MDRKPLTLRGNGERDFISDDTAGCFFLPEELVHTPYKKSCHCSVPPVRRAPTSNYAVGLIDSLSWSCNIDWSAAVRIHISFNKVSGEYL